MQGVEKNIRTTQTALKDVTKLLKLDPTNTELISQKQKYLSEQINDTKTELEALKKASEQAAKSVKNYDAWKKAYDPIQKEIEETGKKITDLKGKMAEMADAGEIETDGYKELQDELAESTKRMRELREAAKEVSAEFGNPISMEQYDALQREMIEKEKTLESLQKEAKKTSKLNANLMTFGEAASGASEKTKALSGAAGGLLAAMTATVPATEELRSDLSKLDNNAVNAGVGIDETRKAFEAFNVVSDETDSSVEATSNLLQAGFTESNLQKAVEGLSGAYLKFPDTMKIESLADSLQETLATGEATGQFGELLDRLGIGAKNFSGELQKCSSDAERQNLVLETLANAGMMDAYNGWQQNNEELARSKQATYEFQESMAQLAETLTPIITTITEFATNVMELFNGLPTPVQNFILALLGIVTVLSPVLGIVGRLSMALGSGGLTTIITGVKTAFTGVAAAITGISAPVLIVIGVVTSLIAIFTVLWKTNEDFRNKVASIWPMIKNLIQIAISNIQAIIRAFVDLVSVIWEQWGDVIMTVVETAISIITTIIDTGLTVVRNLIKLVTSVLKGDWKSAWNAAKNIVSSITSGIKSIVKTAFSALVSIIKSIGSKIGSAVKGAFDSAISFITSLPGKAVKWGSDFIDGIARGIRGAIGKVTSAVKSVTDKITSFIHFSRPDEGPLREYEKWMPDMMEGLAKGIYTNIPIVEKAASAVAKSIDYGVMKDSPAQNIDYNKLYRSVKNGATDSSTVLYIGDREFKRVLTGMGVVFK